MHKICIFTKDRALFGKASYLQFQIQTSTDAPLDEEEDLTKSASGKDFKVLEGLVTSMNRKLSELVTIQKYQMDKETEFSENQYGNMSLVKTLAMVQIGIVMVVGLWQIYYLRNALASKNWVMS